MSDIDKIENVVESTKQHFIMLATNNDLLTRDVLMASSLLGIELIASALCMVDKDKLEGASLEILNSIKQAVQFKNMPNIKTNGEA